MLENLNLKINQKPIDQVKLKYTSKQQKVQNKYEKYVHEGYELNHHKIQFMEKEANVDTVQLIDKKTNMNQPFRINVDLRVPANNQFKKQLYDGLQNKIEHLDDQLSKTQIDKQNMKKIEYHFIDKTLGQLINKDKKEDKSRKPIQKKEREMMKFEQVFINPQIEKINYINEQEKKIIDEMNEGAQIQYDKLLEIYKEDNQNNYITDEKLDKDINLVQHSQDYQQIDQLLLKKQKDINIFEQQIQIQPPDLPNATIASPLTPGNGWAPSIPYIQGKEQNYHNLKELMIKSRAGMQAGDVQKEGHLSFLLAEMFEKKSDYKQAIKYYLKYSKCADQQMDKIGLSLSFNRIAINYYNLQKYNKSKQYHDMNVEISDIDNVFSGLYNLGILYRTTKDIEQSVAHFQRAFEIAQQKNERESMCLSLGQLGITHFNSKNYQAAKKYLSEALELAIQVKNKQIITDCTFQLSLIEDYNQFEYINQSIQQASKQQDQKLMLISLCNYGIHKGKQNLVGQIDHEDCF